VRLIRSIVSVTESYLIVGLRSVTKISDAPVHGVPEHLSRSPELQEGDGDADLRVTYLKLIRLIANLVLASLDVSDRPRRVGGVRPQSLDEFTFSCQVSSQFDDVVLEDRHVALLTVLLLLHHVDYRPATSRTDIDCFIS